MAEEGQTLDPEIQSRLDKIEKDKYPTLLKQIKAEYEIAYAHQKPKKVELLKRYKLYNNQMRDKSKVGDTTMFTVHQTIIASLYNDKLTSEWMGREEGDDEVSENVSSLSRHDYTEMKKDILDYFWIWDACFNGRGLLDTGSFVRDADKGIFVPAPFVIDPIPFLRDPNANSVNGNNLLRLKSARFLGMETKMTKEDIRKHPWLVSSFDIKDLRFGSTKDSLLEEGSRARDEAQNNQYGNKEEKDIGTNGEYDVIDWSTHWTVDGKVQKIRVWCDNKFQNVIAFRELKRPYWNVIDRPLYPNSHDWDGTSIPDLTEDKQRQRAVAQNLGMKSMKADAEPRYIFDTNKVSNKADLNFGFNKFIPSDGDVGGAIMPLRSSTPNMNLLNWVYESLDISAQKATATPEIQQGMQGKEKRTLGEVNIIANKVDTRYSLSAKIFGWSEKEFWLQWYDSYKDNFADSIDKKVVRINGAFGDKFRPFTKENITTKGLDPDVFIESEYISRSKMMEERQAMTALLGIVLQDPTSNKRYAMRKLCKTFGLKKDEIDRLLPRTIDERIAEQQNPFLNKNETVPVLPEDDHNVHLEIHSKANPTPATIAHNKTHERALSIKKTKPELFPQDQQGTTFQDQNQRQMATPDNMGGGEVKALVPSQVS